MRRYTVKVNHIGSAVNEILQYTQIDNHTFCYFLIRINYKAELLLDVIILVSI